MTRLLSISCLALAAALPVAAQELRFPADAAQNAKRIEAQDSLFLPISAFHDGEIEGVTAEGQVEQTAWRVGEGELTTLELLAPLRDAFIAAGFEAVYECETEVCGGFDFRYGIEVLPEPDMHVNLGDFRYFAAQRPDGNGDTEYVSLLVSRSATTGFVQITRIGDPAASAALTASTKTLVPASETVPKPKPDGAIAELLETQGHATLRDLTFRTGSTDLGEENYGSLASLAAYLLENPDRTVMLVGHTDAEGALSSNVVLSRQRATAVMLRLIEEYGVSPVQVNADGVGFLAPRSNNLTPEGRTQNRRVEVILTSTQ